MKTQLKFKFNHNFHGSFPVNEVTGLMSKLNQLLIYMLSLKQSLYNRCRNVRAVFPQTSLGSAITLPNREDRKVQEMKSHESYMLHQS